MRKDRKGQNGKVLVIGGSEQYPGAAALTSIAALRCGTDLVRLACPEKVAWAVNALCPDIITEKMPGKVLGTKHLERILQLVQWCDVFVIGNGNGTAKETQELVAELAKTDKEKVIDADAIKAIALPETRNAIITPHTRELEILYSKGKDIGDNVILLKGPVDKIITREGIRENRTGTNSMTVGGTGDVLAGICAGLLCAGLGREDAAYYAAHVNGRIGETLDKSLGPGMMASDFLPGIARETKNLYKQLGMN